MGNMDTTSITKQGLFLIEGLRRGELDFAFIVVAFMLAIFVMVLFFIQRWISQFIYWIKDGFSIDKKDDPACRELTLSGDLPCVVVFGSLRPAKFLR